MTFDQPLLAHLYWLLPLYLLGVFLASRARGRDLAAFASPGALQRLLGGAAPGLSALRHGLVITALGFLVFAAMGPRWGSTYEKVEQKGRDLLVLLDCSRSMLAEDLAPNRLERAKADLRDLVSALPGHRIGLVGFAGRADLLCPLTTDYAFFNLALNEAGPDSVGRGGTLIGDAVRKALTLFGESGAETRDLLLITDGEDQSSFPEEAAKAAAEQKVKIYAVGLGDEKEGARIPALDSDGRRIYATQEGREVWSRLDARTLRAMALTTGGKYLNLGTKIGDIGSFYLQAVSGEAERSFEAKTHIHKIPRFQIFLGLGLALLLAEFLLGLGAPARGSLVTQPRRHPQITAWLLFTISFFSISFSLSGEARAASAASLVRQGNALYKKGDFAGADRLYDQAEKLKPGTPEIAFSKGTSLAAAGESEKAQESLQRSLAGSKKSLEQRAQYNLGYNAFKGGDYTKAAGYFKDALSLAPRDKDARKNLELALRLAAVSPPPQKKDQKQDEKNKDKNEKKEDQGGGKGGPQDKKDKGADKKPQPQASPEAPKSPDQEKPMTKEEAERLLEQMKAQEKDRRRERLRGAAKPAAVERDW